jgi:hypothetical protein
VMHVLQKEIDRISKGDVDMGETKKRLEGLGYIS